MKISCAFLICLLFVVAVVSSSAVPLKLEGKFDVTGRDQKVDDLITPSDLRSVLKHFKRLLIEAVDKVLQDLLSGAFSERDFPDADKNTRRVMSNTE
ncbi:hypothetical protein ABFA07_023172 [Porites harrisoni]